MDGVKFWAVLQLGGVVWGNVTRAFVERLREKGAKTAQNLEGASDTRPPAGQIMLRPQLSGFGWRARCGQLGMEAYLSGFGHALGFGSARLDEVAGEQAGRVALGGVLLKALHQLKARLG